jgi:hypothetical protein
LTLRQTGDMAIFCHVKQKSIFFTFIHLYPPLLTFIAMACGGGMVEENFGLTGCDWV